MIIILKRNANKEKVENLKTELVNQGFKLHLSEGTEASLIGLIGDTSRIHEDWLKANDVVEDVRRIREPYKKANRSMHPDDTVIDICGRKIGGGNFQVIAGPCSIETKEQITEVASDVKRSGAAFLRGGAFKPRTSPYAFQGLHEQGLDLLLEAKKATGLPVVTEIMSADSVNTVEEGNLPTSPSSPNVKKNMMLGALLGLVISMGFIVLISILDDTVKTPDDVEKYLGLNVLTSIPIQEGSSAPKRAKQQRESRNAVKSRR